jgi:hypothetical protein|nr:hypothetical protein [uncultured Sphaerochaeta sp.]
MINGVVYDFESIKVQLPTGMVSTVEDIKYGVKKDVDVVTDKNGIPRGTVRKAYEGDFEMTLALSEYERLAQSAPRGILALDPFPIVVSMGDGASPVVTDTIIVKITEVPREFKKDDEIKMSVKGKQTAVAKLNGKLAYQPLG